jgi:hypothetical protein
MPSNDFKLVCDDCGSLTVTLPFEADPDPQSILKCGRCGTERGTLQSLRERSLKSSAGDQADFSHRWLVD